MQSGGLLVICMLSVMLANTVGHEREMGCLYTVKAFYISHFVLLDNEESFPKVNSAPSLVPLFFQGHVTVM